MLKTRDIIKYRKSAKRLGLWDADYSPIKKQLSSILDEIRKKDYAMDIVGGSFDQILLMARLVVYGESNSSLSDDDLVALFAPVAVVESLNFVPYMLASGIDSFVDGIFPLFFRTMDESKNKKDFEEHMRAIISSPAHLSTVALSYSIAIGVCLRKYKEATPHMDKLNSTLENMIKESRKRDDVISSVFKTTDPSTISGKSFLFSAMLATAVVECNLGTGIVKLDDMYDFINDINQIAPQDMKDFIVSREFKLYMSSIEEYHELVN